MQEDEDEEDWGYEDLDRDELAERLGQQKLDEEAEDDLKKKKKSVGKFLRVRISTYRLLVDQFIWALVQ